VLTNTLIAPDPATTRSGSPCPCPAALTNLDEGTVDGTGATTAADPGARHSRTLGCVAQGPSGSKSAEVPVAGGHWERIAPG
jgi:hypothetical protein